MNKTELVDAVAQATDLSKGAASKAVSAVLDTIQSALEKGEAVVLTGFGTFAIRERPARTGHNPKTGESMEIKASKSPVFKAGKTLKDAVN
ncbi:MAG: HU family DNA-binding protein [Candidatus Competibacteraceae bacterium]|nr:MAG: HU family DNA-binding protein [Candidatus Competibacteraceae bacterium]